MQTFNQYITGTIDWISVTFSLATVFGISNSMGLDNVVAALKIWFNLKGNPTIGKGKYSYEYSAIFDDGAIIYWGGTAQMGIHVQLHGKYLQNVKGMLDLLRKIVNVGGKITRIDIALDTTEVSCADDVYHAYERGELKTRATNVMRIQSLSGTTVYVGSRYSDRYLRIYDKGKQLKTGTIWTRIELEVKGLKANLYARVVVSEGFDAIPLLIRSFVDVPSVGWYYRATRVTNVQSGIPKVSRMRSTQEWLESVAIPCLVREMQSDEIFKMRALKMLACVLDNVEY